MRISSALECALEAQGRFEEAEPLRRDALVFYERLRYDEYNLREAQEQLADVLLRRGEDAEAEYLYREVIGWLEREGGTESTYYARLSEKLAVLLDGDGRGKMAEPLRKEAASLRWRLVAHYQARIDSYERTGPCAASTAYSSWIENLEKLAGPWSINLAGVLDKYADFERRRGSISRARQLEGRARRLSAGEGPTSE